MIFFSILIPETKIMMTERDTTTCVATGTTEHSLPPSSVSHHLEERAAEIHCDIGNKSLGHGNPQTCNP